MRKVNTEKNRVDATPVMGRELLFQKRDLKSRMWAHALERRGINASALDASPIWLPVWLLLRMIRRGRPIGFAVRYLNDYPGVIKTLVRTISELMLVATCWIARVPIFWICHNVDRESVQIHPRLTAFRRWVIGKAASRIFVTDPLLVKYARQYLRRYGSNFDYVTFGAPGPKVLDEYSANVNATLRNYCADIRARSANWGRRILIGMCVGDDGAKYTHFTHVLPLIERAAEIGVDVFMIVGGNLGEAQGSYFTPDRIRQFKEHPNICLHLGRFQLDEEGLAPFVDFFWRGYKDISVAYTIYVAAAVRRPILALSTGFVGEAVKQYGLGATVRPDMSDLGEALTQLQSWNPANAARFLADHTWDIGAERIASAIRDLVHGAR